MATLYEIEYERRGHRAEVKRPISYSVTVTPVFGRLIDRFSFDERLALRDSIVEVRA